MAAKTRSERDLGKRILIGAVSIILGGFFLSLISLIVLSFLGISLFAVSGNSMAPTLKHGDNIVLKKDDGVRKDQIFLFNKPEEWGYMGDSNPLLIKRTHAIPGDTLTYDQGVFYINGEESFHTIEENYECNPSDDFYEHTLTQEQIYVVGDNAHESLDSMRIFCDGDAEHYLVLKKHLVDYGSILTVF